MTSPDQTRTVTAVPAGAGTLSLTFELIGEVFAVPVGYVHEVIDPLPMTRVPNADPFAPGLINVRGAVVPVLDLRHRLGIPPAEPTADTRFVVLEAEVQDDLTKFAIVADRVDEVVEILSAEVQPVPELGMRWPADCIAGVANHDGQLLILLEIATVFRLDTAA